MTSGFWDGSHDGAVEAPRGLRGKAAAAWLRVARARRARREFQALAGAMTTPSSALSGPCRSNRMMNGPCSEPLHDA